MGLYDEPIEKLQTLIDNWYEIKTEDDFYKVFPMYEGMRNHGKHAFGLCNTCRMIWLECLGEMFGSWIYFSGDYNFPVEGWEEYNDIELITDNPKRLHLAVHCLRWLREHNIVEEY